ncbi:NAD(P)/FAD-dependent oxidoreductase [Vibrio parahaemolyticus]|uniref:NAD(P)/FAD-dependent oxidoreductase n=1 Tax=Vibrio parahaemolyticus TaxID=670 RepID=UPI001E44E262|nr:NAD(P)/FAD-dependent oxidoreductase [Vibrio parahaemolyticus]
MYKKLFSPMRIGNCEIKNRVVMPPMHLGMANLDGTLTEKFMNYYEERAKGGTGMIITEIVRVNDTTGATSFMQPALSHDYHIPSWKEFVHRVKRHGAKLFAQLHHPGRQNLGVMINTVPMSIAVNKVWPKYSDLLFKYAPTLGKKFDENRWTFSSVAPSRCEMSDHAYSRVRALSKREIKQLVQQFIRAAMRAKEADLDGVQLHAAHGYLINQFLSPNTNFRTDEYGGSFENRLRFLKEIIEGIRATCGEDFPIVVRLTVDEFYDKIGLSGKGYKLDEGVKYAKAIESMGVDAIDVSSGTYDTYNYWLEPTSFDCGWRAYLAKAVKQVVSVPVIAANMIRSAEQAEKQLNEGIQDFVSLGRPHIADAHWVNKVENNRESEIKRCINCLNCMETTFKGAFTGEHGYCAANPSVGQEDIYYHLPKDGKGRNVVIVGAGVAGLTCAEILAKRNFNVRVLEKEAVSGGQLNLASKPPGKAKIGWLSDDLTTIAEKNGVHISYSTLATVDLIKEYQPYAVIMATGAEAIKPKFIKGYNKSNVYTTTEVLNGSVDLSGKQVVVVGSGMTGLETSEMLVDNHAQVTIVELAEKLGPNVWHQLREDVIPKLEQKKVHFSTSSKLMEITDNSVRIQRMTNNEIIDIECDSVVLSMGSASNKTLFEQASSNFERCFLIGDASKIGNIAQATRAAFNTAVNEI